uniref:Uncharacterized protein n=1 Tax=Anguilla anguilla TaxID=7936 RepID=A0A0E9XS37_ANGAN
MRALTVKMIQKLSFIPNFHFPDNFIVLYSH